MTVEWPSDDDGPVPLANVGEAGKISYSDEGENATQDSPAVRVFIAGRQALGSWGISPSRAGSLRGNLRGCVGMASQTIHWRHRLAKRTPPRAAQACAVSRLRQRGDKTCERRTNGHVHIRLIKNVCDLITYYTPVLVYKYDLTNTIRMHVTKHYIVGFVFEHSFQLYNF